MIPRLSQKCLLRPEELTPSQDDMRVIGVFNPGVESVDGKPLLMARVVERPKEQIEGKVRLPYWDYENRRIVTQDLNEDEVDWDDPRVVTIKSAGVKRLTFTSHIRIVRCDEAGEIESIDDEYFLPETRLEEFGVEDPRITRIDDIYYITYVSVSRHGATTSLATTRDFRGFERLGVAFYPENKDVVLFPEKIDGQFVALHRPNPSTHFSRPEMWLARSKDLRSWGDQQVLTGGGSDWDSGRVGAGAPPIRVEGGFLEIYHGNQKVPGAVGPYAGGLMLHDCDDPGIIKGKSAEPILVPEADFEKRGFLQDIVFPTGVIDRGDTMWVYYGAADSNIGVVELSKSDLLNALA